MKLIKEKKFKYHYVDNFISKLVKKSDVLLQLDIHPGEHCGLFKCCYCYGKGQKQEEGRLTINDYRALLKEVKNRVDFIELSGIISDPLSYPDFNLLLKLIKKYDFRCGIHTKGYFLNKDIIKTLVKAEEGDFITISLDAAEEKLYNKIHGLPMNSNVFSRVVNSVTDLRREKLSRKSKLRVNLTYLLLKHNCSKEQIREFINRFRDYADIIRFSFPQLPNMLTSCREEPTSYLTKEEEEKVSKVVKNFLNERIILLKFNDNCHVTHFNKCWTQKFNFIVDKSGNVFPCPQVATSEFSHLIYGNIKKESFSKIWNGARRKKILEMPLEKMNCRICDRKDENINMSMENIQ
ncbi:MAG: radical SAM protein [Candidatus Omnitrophica bacterium]|nr:radical SAM protein [Candidatus Omnitrophota bacterium]